MDIVALNRRADSQRALVVQTEKDLQEAIKNKWPLAQRELTLRLNRQKKALENTQAVIAEVSKK